ncbi:MAG: M23 family metallopeptidase [Myxococcales bacterium]|nr:M23 family metallopeptidase [Myxococcales bacterium]
MRLPSKTVLLACSAWMACGPAEPEAPVEVTSAVTGALRDARLTAIRDYAAARGLSNSLLLAGISDAETNLAHCYSEATYHCEGPYSAECGGPVLAGSGDGPCYLLQGGLGFFQFDGGTHSQTLAREGNRILSVQGSTEAAVEFVVAMVRDSIYVPGVATDAEALAWINAVRVDDANWSRWINTVAHYYNGCPAATCSVYADRYAKYNNFTRNLLAEKTASFWYGSSASSVWRPPLGGSAGIDFNVVNPSVAGYSSCFNRPIAELVHSGEDWFGSTSDQVHAIGPGQVVYAQWANYPGYVIVVRHDLGAAEAAAVGTSTLYSMYGHVDVPNVTAGDLVDSNTVLANLYYQPNNTHLHFEVRTVEIPQLCGYNAPGPGYTNAGTNATAWGYRDPTNQVALLAGAGTSGPTCDNNVPLGGTACAAQSEAREFLCVNPGGANPWQERACPSGQLCIGDRCQPVDCSGYTDVATCDAHGAVCAFYYCSNSCWPRGTPISTACPGPLTAPTGLTPPYTTVTTPSVTLGWNAVSGATTYDVSFDWWDTSANVWRSYYTWTGLTGTSFTVWPAYDNRHYLWRVRACASGSCSPWSNYNQFYFTGL